MALRATPADAGCWIEGSRGHYATPYLVEIGRSHGMPVSDEDMLLVDHWSGGDLLTDVAYEAVIGLADQAETYLNEEVAPKGYSFGWHDGEFFLWPDKDWQE